MTHWTEVRLRHCNLPEACDEETTHFRAGFKTIAEISKADSDEQARKSREAAPPPPPRYRLSRAQVVDSSNMKDVYYAPDAVKQADLLAQIETSKRTGQPRTCCFKCCSIGAWTYASHCAGN